MRHKSATVGAKVTCADYVLTLMNTESRFFGSQEAEGVAERQGGEHRLHEEHEKVLHRERTVRHQRENEPEGVQREAAEPKNTDALTIAQRKEIAEIEARRSALEQAPDEKAKP